MVKFDAGLEKVAMQGFKIQLIAPMEYPPEAGDYVLIGLDIPAGGPLEFRWCASVNNRPQWDGATIVRADGMEADFYTDTPQEMVRILTTRGYPVKRMLILEK